MGLTDLPWRSILVRAAKSARADGVTDVAAMLAYYAFLAVPAALLVTLGVFTVVAGEDTVDDLVGRLSGVVPPEALTLLDESLTRALENASGGIALIVVGAGLALWTATGAMGGLMRGLNRVYDQRENRPFVRQRLYALAMLGCVVIAFALVFVLLILGPVLSGWVGDVLDAERAVGWIWWIAQWPVLLGGLFACFAAVLYLGPNREPRQLRLITPGAAVAVVIWLAASGLFALYVSLFGSYNKAWGSLAAVIIFLTWLWLSSLALLLGAEVNKEAEREA
jgi:membrane protein